MKFAYGFLKFAVAYTVGTLATKLVCNGMDRAKDWVTKKCASES